MRRHPADSTNRSLAAFKKLQHIHFDTFAKIVEENTDISA